MSASIAVPARGTWSHAPALWFSRGRAPAAGIWSAPSVSVSPSWPVRVTVLSSVPPLSQAPFATRKVTVREMKRLIVSVLGSEASTVSAALLRTSYVPGRSPVTALPVAVTHSEAPDARYSIWLVTPVISPSSFATDAQSWAAGPMGACAFVTSMVCTSLASVTSPAGRRSWMELPFVRPETLTDEPVMVVQAPLVPTRYCIPADTPVSVPPSGPVAVKVAAGVASLPLAVAAGRVMVVCAVGVPETLTWVAPSLVTVTPFLPATA